MSDLTVAEICERLQTSREAVYGLLVWLEATHLITKVDPRLGIGRPANVYRFSENLLDQICERLFPLIAKDPTP